MRAKRLPQIGWNSIFRDEDVYFVHSLSRRHGFKIYRRIDRIYGENQSRRSLQDGLSQACNFTRKIVGRLGFAFSRMVGGGVEREITTAIDLIGGKIVG